MIGAQKEIRYLPIFLMLMLAVFSAICVYFYFRSTRAVHEVLRVQVDEASIRIAKDIEGSYGEVVRELSFLTRNNLLPVLYSNAGISVLENERRGADFIGWFRNQTNKKFNLIAFVDSAGNELYASAITETASSLSQVETVGEDQQSASSVYDITRLSNSAKRFEIHTISENVEAPYVRAMAKIKFRGQEGAAVTELALEELFNIPPSTVYTLVVERKTGSVVFCNESVGFWGKALQEIYPELNPVVDATVDSTASCSSDIETKLGGLSLCSRHIQAPDWVAVSYIKSDRFVESTERTGQLTLVACFVFFVACGFIVNRLIGRIDEQNKALSQELEKAHEMQMRLMPESSPQISGFEMAGICRPATHVGGDFYQYFQQHEGNLVLTLADVTGHGMQAAIPTVLFSGILQNEMEENVAPDMHLSRLNRSLHQALDRRTFVCCTMAVLDLEQKQMTLTNGGCPYPYHYQASTQSAKEVALDGFPLGVRPQSKYDSIELRLEPGDALVFCSDGIIEAENKQGMFGFEQTAEAIEQAASRNASAEEIIDHLMDSVDSFVGSAEQLDDQTIVVLKVLD
jgi:serine phosphatase RsbU (regulator of sigma subunit)